MLVETKVAPRVTVIGRAVHSPWNEGTRVIARNIGLALRDRGYDTHTISLSEDVYRGQGEFDNLSTQHISSRVTHAALGDYRYLWKVAQAVHAHNASYTPSTLHLIGAPLALGPLVRRPNRKVIAHVTLSRQMYLPFSERARAALGWRVFDRWIDAYACTAEQIRDDLLNQGYDARKLFVVPPPLDVQHFQRAERTNARMELGFDQDAFIMAYVGTVSPLRFPAESIMRAVSLASKHIPNLAMEIFAPVVTHHYNLAWAKANVGNSIREGGVPVNVHLQDLTEAEKVLVYNAADIVLLPFSAPVAVEPPLTLLEAMACEAVPVVAPYANRSNVVQHAENGFTYDSPDDLAAQLTLFHGLGAQRRAAIGEQARASVVRRFSFATAAEAIEDVWARLVLYDTKYEQLKDAHFKSR